MQQSVTRGNGAEIRAGSPGNSQHTVTITHRTQSLEDNCQEQRTLDNCQTLTLKHIQSVESDSVTGECSVPSWDDVSCLNDIFHLFKALRSSFRSHSGHHIHWSVVRVSGACSDDESL